MTQECVSFGMILLRLIMNMCMPWMCKRDLGARTEKDPTSSESASHDLIDFHGPEGSLH